MTDFLTVQYAADGSSTAVNSLGMRAMQQRVYDARGAQYLLVKSPPASGKSRALMFVALDKLRSQGLKKVIVVVPERSIGGSFRSTDLKTGGFSDDWRVEDRNDLCAIDAVSERLKVAAFRRFMASDDRVLLCTHATFRFAFEATVADPAAGVQAFDECFVAVDEFHHTSADADNKLGEIVRRLVERDCAHIMAMTGSYFRGDRVPVMRAEDEARFTRVTYTYYEQLSGYQHLRTLGIGYHFYTGPYTDSVAAVLDPSKKTIIHIPNVNSAASLQDKEQETFRIIAALGEIVDTDRNTGFYLVKTPSGCMLKVADLVTPGTQQVVLAGLRAVREREDLDVVIALQMAKEGFDWLWCEHALTIGYRNSLTEIVQIIGRTTRDAPGKAHAQFTNLLAEPDDSEDVVKDQVNDMLKAVACSLLMEQVLAPNFNFKTKPTEKSADEGSGQATQDVDLSKERPVVLVSGLKTSNDPKVQEILQSDMQDLMAAVLQDRKVLRAGLSPGEFPIETVTQNLIPQIIQTRFPDLDDDGVETVRQHLLARTAAINSLTLRKDDGGSRAVSPLLQMTSQFLSMPELDIDLIDRINPFMASYEILSKALTESMLRRVHSAISATRIDMSEPEAMAQIPRIREFKERTGREPDPRSANPSERRMGEALAWIRHQTMLRRRQLQKG